MVVDVIATLTLPNWFGFLTYILYIAGEIGIGIINIIKFIPIF